MKSNKVEVQKGESFNPNMKTMKTMTHSERVVERSQEIAAHRDRVTMTTFVPKQGKK